MSAFVVCNDRQVSFCRQTAILIYVCRGSPRTTAYNLVPGLFTRRSPTRWRKDPGSGWSRGHLNYFVLGEGGPKKLDLFDLFPSSKLVFIRRQC